MTKKKGRGGARPGAGIKKVEGYDLKKQVGFYAKTSAIEKKGGMKLVREKIKYFFENNLPDIQ